MLSTFKAVLNSLNQRKYIKNINNIKLERVDENAEYSNNIVKKEGSRELIDKLETKTRIKNFNNFCSNYWSIRKYRFKYVSLPVILTVASAASFKLPSDFEINGKAEKYTKEITTYSSSKGINSDYVTAYDLSELQDFFGVTIANDDSEIISSSSNRIDLKMHDYERAIEAGIEWKKNGDLEVSSFSSVLEYLDTDDLRDINFDAFENDEDYAVLFDRLINIIKNSGFTKEKSIELIDSLSASEKREIILRIIKYVDEGEVDIMLSMPLNSLKLGLLGFTVLYYIYALLMYYLRKSSYYVYDFEIKNGNLLVDETAERRRTPGNLFDEALRAKEAYLAAERERVLLLWDEIKENVAPDDRGKILTKYERKLIMKNTGDNVPKK